MGNSLKRKGNNADEAVPERTEEDLNEVVSSLALTKYNLTLGDKRLVASLIVKQHMFVLTDPAVHDNPLIYCSTEFCTLTGYGKDEIIGRNCRFLQGSSTTLESISKIKKAVANKTQSVICLVNYTKAGKLFYNHFFISPLFDINGKCVLFIGIQRMLEEEFTPGQVSISPSEYLNDLLRTSRGGIL